MLEALKHEDVINLVGGRFKLAALVQRRWRELMFGSRPMVDPKGKTTLEVVIQEIREGKIGIDYQASNIDPPKPTKKS